MQRHRALLLSLSLLFALACTCAAPLALLGEPTEAAATLPSATPQPAPTMTPLPPTFTLVPTDPAIGPTATQPTLRPTDSPAVTPTTDLEALTPTPDPVTAEKTERQLRVFQRLWETIRDVYVYSDFNGVDWVAVNADYRVQIEAGINDQAFYPLMQQMIDELGDEHSHMLSPDDLAAQEAEAEGNNDYVGIGVLISAVPEEDILVILVNFPGSPAERAGLLPHDNILLADGQPVVDDDGGIRADLLRGPVGSPVTLLVRTPGEEPREVVIVRERITGGLPVDARLLPNPAGKRILYMLIPTFSDQTIPGQIEVHLQTFTADGPLDGVIIDNRINGGGYSNVLETTLSYFTEGEQGQFYDRVGDSRPLVIRPRGINGSQAVPLVVLVGEGTASFAEVFSGVLQDSGRARLVGGITDGNVETLHPYDFEDGSRVYIAQETFIPALSGADWERDGLIPDRIVESAWHQVTFDNDPVLAAALELLGAQ